MEINLTLLWNTVATVYVPDQLSWSQQDPKERLGCQVQTGFTDIKSHTFFRSIDWDQVRADWVSEGREAIWGCDSWNCCLLRPPQRAQNVQHNIQCLSSKYTLFMPAKEKGVQHFAFVSFWEKLWHSTFIYNLFSMTKMKMNTRGVKIIMSPWSCGSPPNGLAHMWSVTKCNQQSVKYSCCYLINPQNLKAELQWLIEE